MSKGLLASSAPFCHALVTLRHSESFCFIISVEISLFFFNFCNNMRKTAVISFVSVWESSLVKSPGSTYFFEKKLLVTALVSSIDIELSRFLYLLLSEFLYFMLFLWSFPLYLKFWCWFEKYLLMLFPCSQKLWSNLYNSLLIVHINFCFIFPSALLEFINFC